MSAFLSTHLKGIFISCFGTVFVDVVKELEFAVSELSESSKASKRRRLNIENIYEERQTMDINLLQPLQDILLCTESVLKADAHEGGNWIRANEGQRYNLLLSPLSTLLQAKVPPSFLIELGSDEDEGNRSSPYEMLELGNLEADNGCVVGCVVALAAAAGNDQLWKPLNYAIMDACGNENRAEVRKVGVNTLLKILQLLGEEYMILLPECLPVLSELLEEQDEEIAAVARECIRLGEELLGESLEDNLR